jgi:hypothetical protein
MFIHLSIVFYLFLNIYRKFGGISPNVSAVYDGLTARIKKCVAFLGLANYAGATAWE